MRLHLAAALIAGAALPAGGAVARTIRFPDAKPAVMFDVPDDWTVTPADGGLQLVSPDRTSIILAGMAKSDRAGLAAWQRAAGQRMVDFGIAFDAKANPGKANAPKGPGASGESGPIAPLADPGAGPKVKAGELAPLSSVPSMALLGRPSDLSVADLEASGTAGKAEGTGAGAAEASGSAAAKSEAAKPEAAKPEAAKSEAAKPEAAKPEAAKPEVAKPEAAKSGSGGSAADKGGKPLHFASVVIRGASLAGKPVDVQFLNFGYSKSEWFLMQQESGPDDARAGAIVKSVRAIR